MRKSSIKNVFQSIVSVFLSGLPYLPALFVLFIKCLMGDSGHDGRQQATRLARAWIFACVSNASYDFFKLVDTCSRFGCWNASFLRDAQFACCWSTFAKLGALEDVPAFLETGGNYPPVNIFLYCSFRIRDFCKVNGIVFRSAWQTLRCGMDYRCV